MTKAGSDLFARPPLFVDSPASVGELTLVGVADGIGTALVGLWPPRVAFAVELLDFPSPALVVSGDSIRVFCANARAAYRAIGRDDWRRTIVGELQDWEIGGIKG